MSKNKVIIIIFVSINEIKMVNFDIKPKRGGSPPSDKINEIIIRLLDLFFWVNINNWLPILDLNIFIRGIEIII